MCHFCLEILGLSPNSFPKKSSPPWTSWCNSLPARRKVRGTNFQLPMEGKVPKMWQLTDENLEMSSSRWRYWLQGEITSNRIRNCPKILNSKPQPIWFCLESLPFQGPKKNRPGVVVRSWAKIQWSRLSVNPWDSSGPKLRWEPPNLGTPTRLWKKDGRVNWRHDVIVNIVSVIHISEGMESYEYINHNGKKIKHHLTDPAHVAASRSQAVLSSFFSHGKSITPGMRRKQDSSIPTDTR